MARRILANLTNFKIERREFSNYGPTHGRPSAIKDCNAIVTVQQSSSRDTEGVHKVAPNYISFFSPQPDTGLHCQTTDTRLLDRAVCLFASQHSPVPTVPTQGGMARLSWPGWSHTGMAYSSADGHPSEY